MFLFRKHGVFGSQMEYTERLAKLHERQRLEEYAALEGDEDHENGHDGRRE
jgi:menaquinol-cytochrome c reductase cytochrome b subunit